MASLISSVLWVPRSVSARHPRTYDLSDPAELARVEKLGKIKLDEARRELEEMEALEQRVDGMQVNGAKNANDDDDGDEWESDSQSSNSENDLEQPDDKAVAASKAIKAGAGNKTTNGDDIDAQYNLDSYDKEVSQSQSLGIFGNIKGLSYHAGEDPYVTLENPNEEDATLEREELEILPTDNLLITAKTADEISLLEVHVYENPDADSDKTTEANAYEGNLYVHHDTLLPAMPLSLEWGDHRPSTSVQKGKADASDKGSFVAVGTMDKQIEIWDLDVVEGLFPEAILGDDSEEGPAPDANGDSAEAGMEVEEGQKPKSKKKKKKKAKNLVTTLPHAHTSSILSLSWNRTHRSLLASSSADSTIKLWDLSSPECSKAIRSFNLHEGKKVQSIQWNHVEPTVLLAGSWEGIIKIFDTRTPDAAVGTVLPGQADVEVLHWDPHGTSQQGAEFYAATGKGQVLYYDSRDLSKPQWTLDAHDGATAALDVNEFIPGCFATGGIDKQTKIWNVNVAAGSGKKGISLVTSRDFGVGRVFSATWNPDEPTILAMAGSNAKVNVWDTWTNAGFRKTFGDRVRALDLGAGFAEGSKREKAKGLATIEDDGEALTSDEE